MFDLTQDFTNDQLQAMLHWMWVNKFTVSRANIKGWRKKFMR